MGQPKTLTGECLCGDVSWSMSGPFEFLGMCQCSRCRKVTGSAFATNLFVKPDQFSWLSGKERRNEYALASPNTFGNAFCKTCGSGVPRNTTRGWVIVPLGSSMELPGIEPTLVCPEDHTDWFTGLESLVNPKN
jgi:hypothetical protein